MFPHRQSGDFLFHCNPHQEDGDQQDLIFLGQASMENYNNRIGKGKRNKILAAGKDDDGISNINNEEEKKIMRREIERQRRQHMNMLHASLRSLLPHEFVKVLLVRLQGRRSLADHLNEAKNYINYLKKNIQHLSLERDKLKSLLPNEEAHEHGNPSSDNCLRSCVTVQPYSGGVEIVISSVLRKENLPLSEVLKHVLAEGLDVIRCVSTQTDDKIFHTFLAEVGDLTYVDLRELQLKLNQKIM